MLDLKRQYARIREEVQAAIEDVCQTQYFIGGSELEAMEREMAAYLGTRFVVGCASGTDALWLALAAAGVGPGSSVITTPFSFFASVSSIVRAGARPLFVDIDPTTLNLDPEAVGRKLHASYPDPIRAVIPVHLYGQCADMDAFQRLGKEHKLVIVEDAAQAFGASWRGRRAGSLGDFGAFSFYPTKNLSAYGDGGCVSTNSPEMAARVRMLGNHGSKQRYYHDEIGWNSRLDALQASILRVKLRHLDTWNAERRARAEAYDHLLLSAGLAAARNRGGMPDHPVQMLASHSEAAHIFHQYVIRAQRRDDLRKFLGERGIGAEVYYPLPLSMQKCFSYLGYREGDFPESERAAREVLALPMFPELTGGEQNYVVEAIAAFYS